MVNHYAGTKGLTEELGCDDSYRIKDSILFESFQFIDGERIACVNDSVTNEQKTPPHPPFHQFPDSLHLLLALSDTQPHATTSVKVNRTSIESFASFFIIHRL
jgi:hypothetical protein